jgi:hypothetical protein
LVVIGGEEETQSFKLSYRIEATFDCVTGMVVDNDDNLILADEYFLRMYSKDGQYVKECKLGGTAWDISYHKKSDWTDIS